jgi:excisionase family DNA binding protein
MNRSKTALETSVDVDPIAYTVAEVATALRVSYDTALRLVKSGEIPAFRVGSSYRVHREHLIDVTRAASEAGRDLLATKP